MEFSKPFRFNFAEAVVIKELLRDVAIGRVTTGEPGTDVTVNLHREGDAFLFDFVIPRGESAEKVAMDSTLDGTSDNAVKNRVIKAYVDEAIRQLQAALQSGINALAEDLEALAGGSLPSLGTRRVEMPASQSSAELEPGILYVFPEMPSLTVALGGEANPTRAQEYRFRFISGDTATVLTLPDGVVGGMTVEANRVYEVSVLDGYLASQCWEAL